MSRRQIFLAVVMLSSMALTACGSNPTAPSRDGDEKIIILGSGG